MPNSALRTPYSPFPHALAVVLVCATFPLIWVGGLVTSYDAGMAVPDWPTTYGYNMFLYPWQSWIVGPFDLFIEHGHRLLGSLVGMISIATLIVVWCFDRRTSVRVLAAAILVAVIFQGVLGGMRVVASDVQLAKVHGIFATAFFAMTISLAVVTSRLWQSSTARHIASAGKLHRLAVITTGLVFLQIVVGAHLRHLPADWQPGAFRVVVFFHLLLAGALLFYIGLTTSRVIFCHRDMPALFRPAVLLLCLIGVQLCLGAGAWIVNYSWPAWAQGWGFTFGHTVQAGSFAQAMTSTAHQAIGALILGVAVMLSLRSLRLLRSVAPARLVSEENSGLEQPATSTKLLGVLA